MTDRALSEAAMLTSLRDVRLPAEAAGGMAADLAATVALAGCAALLIATALRLLSLRKRSDTSDTLADQLARLSALPEADKRVALLHVLRAHAPERYRALRGALYQPTGGVATTTLEAEVKRLV